MRYSQGDLPILSAEVYDPGTNFIPPQRSTGKKTASREGSKKRKAHSPDGENEEHEEEEKKRARGRPRLDTKDETAAERRRTQIRLAQRAYRNRKENAIQTLERKVQELKETNEEMSNAFMTLHDFAVSHGLLEQAPEFARQLQTTTHMFLSLARRSSDESGKDDEQTGSPDNSNTEATKAPQQEKSPSGQDVVPITAPTGIPVTDPQLFGGIMVSHEPLALAKRAAADVTVSFDAPSSTLAQDYEIVTYPTIENASFPLGSDFDFNSIDNVETTPLYPTLPPPKSFSIQEATFGRRLQRRTVERALDIISMPHPPEARIAKVFGFCLLFESKEDIRRRLEAVVDRQNQESLYYWEYPFLNLGGAGTHFDTTNFNGQPIGNQGTIDVGKPKSNSGFGTGPYNSQIVGAGNLVDKNFRVELNGYGADFYDCDEVELYLRQRGITIPGGLDYITAEIDMNDFENTDSSSFNGNSVVGPNDLFGRGQAENDLAATMSAARSAPLSPSTTSGDASTAVTVPSPGPELSKPWTPTDPLLDTSYAASSSNAFIDPISTAAGFSSSSLLALSAIGINARERLPRRKVVTVDVNVLIYEMTERATCLGRTPGLKKSDINEAFVVSIRGL